ncbi:MAG: KilA-N domain-containing protein [Campylobacteraceae bacterium]
MAKSKIIVSGKEIQIQKINENDYICLTDMVRGEEGTDHIKNWMRNRNTVEYLGIWEQMHNSNFKGVEFDTFKKEAGLNAFTLTPKKWVEATNAIGIISKSGKYGGTYAHKDIAFNFGMWISPTFQLFLVKEYQRLKELESNVLNIEWNSKRLFSKINYKLHTDAIQNYIIPKGNYAKDQEWLAYADEADMLNIIIFGCTAQEWRKSNPSRVLAGENIRDMASINELLVLANLESLNSILVQGEISKENRFNILKQTAYNQFDSLDKNDKLKFTKKTSDDVYIEFKELPQIEKKNK